MKTARHITIIISALLLTACSERQGQLPATTSGDDNKRPLTQIPLEDKGLAEIGADPTAKPEEHLTHHIAPAAKRLHSRQELDYAAVQTNRPGVAGVAVVAPYPHPPVDRENYLQYERNGVKLVREQPLSTFSVDVDTAGYANVRRMLVREGRLPPADAVRLEEMINYFSYSYEIPESDAAPFSINTELAPAPWSERHQLLQIGLKGFEPQLERRPPANLVFLVDVSGSMQSPDKLGLVKKSLRLLVNSMTAEDRIALTVYAGAAGTVLASTPGNEKAKILAAIDGLQAEGSTHGSAGIELA
jgi:Ca-activated chloride channel family protein